MKRRPFFAVAGIVPVLAFSLAIALHAFAADDTKPPEKLAAPPEKRPPVDFPVTDFHVHLKGGLTVEEALAGAKVRGIGLGIGQNCGVGFPVTDDEGARRFLASLDGKPVFKGMQAEGREWVRMFSPETIARFDYVFTDAMTFFGKDGKRMRLWMPDEVTVGDPQEFMELLVRTIVTIISNEPIDIYANATFLPAAIAGRYDTLWTDERMAKVIEAAVKNEVAIEINARFRIPSAAFIRKAKLAGARFSFGTNNGDKDLGDLAYCFAMAKQCGLTKDDLFVPKPDGKKPIQRKQGAGAAR